MSTEPNETHDRREQEGAGKPDVNGLVDASPRGEVVPLGMLRRDDLEWGGGKGANPGELILAGLDVPTGFCVTIAAYRHAVAQAGVANAIDEVLRDVRTEDPASVEAASARISTLFERLPLPGDLAEVILAAHRSLGAPAVAVRSSATAEDLPGASFAGQQALFYLGAGWPTLRRLALELGRRLAESGSLLSAEDVFFLETSELRKALTARDAGQARPELARQARDRRELREARKRLHPPPVVPPNYKLRFGPIDMSAWETQRHNEPTGAVLRGFAVSPGRVSAPASVIYSPEAFSRMEPGTVLVCPTTTPAWTPLFSQARGLVTDVGGVLAHSSIVAREYGIPAVLGTGQASQRIRHGQSVTVDGDRGEILLEESGQRKDQVMAKKRWRDLSVPHKMAIVLSSAVQVALLGVALADIYRRPEEEIRGKKWTWAAASFVNFLGPISYFLFGRKW